LNGFAEVGEKSERTIFGNECLRLSLIAQPDVPARTVGAHFRENEILSHAATLYACITASQRDYPQQAPAAGEYHGNQPGTKMLREALLQLLGGVDRANKIALEASIQAIIETRVGQELNRLRDFNRRDLEDIRKDQLKFWRIFSSVLAYTTILLGVVMYEYDKGTMETLVNYAVNKEIANNLHSDIQNVVDSDAQPYINESLSKFRVEVKSNLDASTSEAYGLNKQLAHVLMTLAIFQRQTDDLQQKITAQQGETGQLNDEATFIVTAIAAENDSRPAFDQLLAVSNNPASKYQELASTETVAIASSGFYLSLFTGSPSDAIWGDYGYNKDTVTIEQCHGCINKFNNADYKADMISFVWSCQRFSMYDKLDYMADVIRTSNSITAVRYAMSEMAGPAQQYGNLLVYKSYPDWWDKNKDKYKPATTPTSSH
jgi:hypothetical protein